MSERITKNYTTGKGVLTGFTAIFEPSTKFVKTGSYQARLLLPKEEGEKIAELAKEIRTEQFKKYGKGTKAEEVSFIKPYTTADEETGEEVADPEGRYLLKTNAKAWIKQGKPTNKILVVDSQKNIMKYVAVGEGTVAKLLITIEGYTVDKVKTGVTSTLKAVQIIDLVEFGNLSVDDTGFEVEDGYIFSEDETTAEAAEEVTETEDDEADF